MNFRQFTHVVELRTKVVSVSTFCLCCAALVRRVDSFNGLNAFILFAAMILIDMGTTGFNSYFDYIKGVDNHADNKEKDKVILREGLQAFEVQLLSLLLFALASLFGLILAIRVSWFLIPVGVVCMGIGYFYSAGPKPISHTPLGEIFAGTFLGSVLFCICWFCISGSITPGAVLLSLPSTFFIASILAVNNACDLLSDKKAGRLTLAILIRPKGAEILIYCLWALALLTQLFLIRRGDLFIMSYWLLIAELLLLIRSLMTLHRRGFSSDTKGPSMGIAVKNFSLFSILYALMLLMPI